jgi:ABC-2 type transport system permease protein
MKKLLYHKYWWIAVIVLFIAVVALSSLFHYRIDLTKEKRFSLTAPTKNMLSALDSTVQIQVFLTGDLPADYKKLSQATEDLLRDFRDESNNQVTVSFEKPGESLNDTARLALYDSLSRMGVVFDRTEEVSSTTETRTDQLIIPSALVYYRDQRPVAIDLRSSRKVFRNYNVVNDVPQEDVEATRNAAEALLEFKFANAIDKLTRKKIPTIAYLVGNGEPTDLTINDLGESIRNEYRLGVFDIKQAYPDASKIDALIIVKPSIPFTEEDKLRIDQYVMNGGKVLWFVDKLYAEMDSLMRSKTPEFVAYDRNLNLDDILFKYGVRINNDLVQDMNCSSIPLVVGQNPDNSPRMQRVPWPYYPFLSARMDNPISKNLDRILPIFPSTIDTVRADGIKKTVLLATDTNSRSVSSPALVSMKNVFEILQQGEFASFNKSYLPVAILLEGKFTSLYANRFTQQLKDSVTAKSGLPFLSVGSIASKQIVASDADLVTNAVSKTTGPMQMGILPMEEYRFANREFFLNAVDYLVNNSGIFEARNKDFTLRLLDKEKLANERSTWQFINVGVPIIALVLFGFIFLWLRKRQFTTI